MVKVRMEQQVDGEVESVRLEEEKKRRSSAVKHGTWLKCTQWVIVL